MRLTQSTGLHCAMTYGDIQQQLTPAKYKYRYHDNLTSIISLSCRNPKTDIDRPLLWLCQDLACWGPAQTRL